MKDLAQLRDVLLTAAERDLYSPLWSSDVLDEMERALIEKRRLTKQQTARLREKMTRAFPDSTVSGYGSLIASQSYVRCRRANSFQSALELTQSRLTFLANARS